MSLSRSWELLTVDELPDEGGEWRRYKVVAAVSCSDGSLRIVSTVVDGDPASMEALRRSEGV